MNALEMRERQEVTFTLSTARAVADGSYVVDKPEMWVYLNRFARWRMQTTFSALVEEMRQEQVDFSLPPEGFEPATHTPTLVLTSSHPDGRLERILNWIHRPRRKNA